MKAKDRASKPIEYRGQKIRTVKNRPGYLADFTANGGRERKMFRALAEAKTWIDQKNTESKSKGRAAFGLSDRDRIDIMEARRWLGSIPLTQVFDFWRKHHPVGDCKTVEAIIDEFMEAPGRRGTRSVQRRQATIDGHKWRLAAFCKAFGIMQAHEVTADAIEQWLDVNRWTGINRRHYLASVRALYAFAVRKKHVAVNPAIQIETPGSNPTDPVIMTPADVQRYLAAIETAKTVKLWRGTEYRTDCADMLPREVLAFFCGLRPEECSRIDWQNISFENRLVTVTGDVAKIQGRRRNIPLPDCAIAWLIPYRKDAGPVWPHTSPTTLHRKRSMARAAAGVDVPDNAGRHAFASYHLAKYHDAPKTADAMGHSDIKMLKNVYTNIVSSDGAAITEAMANEYFNIMPDAAAIRRRFKTLKTA